MARGLGVCVAGLESMVGALMTRGQMRSRKACVAGELAGTVGGACMKMPVSKRVVRILLNFYSWNIISYPRY